MKSEALRELERLAYEDKRKRYPAVPDVAIMRTKYSDASTNDLQTAIVDYLDLIGGWGVRVNTQGQYVEKLGRFIPGQTKRGTPDILGALPGGRFIAIECKQPKEKLRDDQEDIRQDITRAGALHLIAYVDDFQSVYETINAIICNQLTT